MAHPGQSCACVRTAGGSTCGWRLRPAQLRACNRTAHPGQSCTRMGAASASRATRYRLHAAIAAGAHWPDAAYAGGAGGAFAGYTRAAGFACTRTCARVGRRSAPQRFADGCVGRVAAIVFGQ